MKKRILAMLLALSTILSVLNFSTVAYAVSINDSSAFIKQSPSHCTHASAVNMLRRRAIIDGLSNWNSITESSTSSALWAGGLYNSFTYSGMSASVYSLSGDKKATLISELANHPEGIVIYHTGSDQHAVLLTSYDSSTDTFYCFDPIPSKPNYIIPLTSAYLPGSTQSAKISSLHYYWKLTNKSGYPYVDLGTNFFGVILNTACWKPIECGSDGIVRLQAETGKSNQVWYFVRQSDGSYVINSASNGKALEMYNGITTNGTAVQVHDADWGGNYQRWYIYPQGSGYIIKSKHYQELNKVLDLNGGSTVNGNVIDTYTQNNTAAQIWSIYKADDVQLKAPTLSVTAGKSATNTKFSWSQVYGETYYILNIKKNGSTYKNIEGIYDTSYSINLPSGSYTATVQAANYYHGKTSTSVSFTVTDSTYTVTLNNQSPTTCGTTSVTATYGLAMPKITVPTKTGHTFGGYYTGTNGSGTQYYKADGTSARNWDKTATTTLYAKWTPNKYTVTFKNHDGTVLETKSVEYGSTATYTGATPTKPADAQYTYTFSGWDKALSNITANTTIIAKFTSTKNKYTVTFKNHDGTVLETKSVNYGSGVTYTGATPTKKADAQYTYTFSGWDKALTNITANTVITAKFTSTKNKYTVTFKNHDGTVLETKSVEHGSTAAYTGATPTKPADAQYTYTFLGWDKALSNITANTVITAKFTSTVNNYKITFNTMGGTTEIESKIIAYGSTCGELPVPQKDGYTFKGWYTKETDGEEVTSETEITSDTTLYAVWEAIPYTNTTVTKLGGQLITGTKVFNIDEPYEIIIAGYKNKQFVSEVVAIGGVAVLSGDIDQIKVMVWDGFESLKPLCKAEEVTSDKFITE